jgi:hypothetical protein
MPNDLTPYLLGYPSSFCVSPGEARDNLRRMIEAEIPGWHGGPELWAERLGAQLALPNRTRKLNRYGARFTALEWVWLMRGLLRDCELAMARRPDPPETAALADVAPARLHGRASAVPHRSLVAEPTLQSAPV